MLSPSPVAVNQINTVRQGNKGGGGGKGVRCSERVSFCRSAIYGGVCGIAFCDLEISSDSLEGFHSWKCMIGI